VAAKREAAEVVLSVRVVVGREVLEPLHKGKRPVRERDAERAHFRCEEYPPADAAATESVVEFLNPVKVMVFPLFCTRLTFCGAVLI